MDKDKGDQDFTELLAASKVCEKDKDQFVNYARMTRCIRTGSCDDKALVQAFHELLHEEIEKVNRFSDTNVQRFREEHERIAKVLSGQRLPPRRSSENPSSSSSSSSLLWKTLRGAAGGSSALDEASCRSDVERLYQEVQEHMRYIRLNAEAVARIAEKYRDKGGCLPQDLEEAFSRAEGVLASLVEDIESLYPKEELQHLHALASGDDFGSSRLTKGWQYNFQIYYTFVVFCLVVPCCYFAITQPEPKARCAAVLMLLVLLNLTQVVPLFCTALLTPAVCIMFHVVPYAGKSHQEIANTIIIMMFNQTSFIVLAAFTANVAINSCQIELRFANAISASGLSITSPSGLLVLMMGTMFLAGLCPAGPLMMAAILPTLRDISTNEHRSAKTVLLGIMMAANIGGHMFPLSSPQALVAMSVLVDYHRYVPLTSWVVMTVPFSIVACLFVWVLLNCYPGLPKARDQQAQRRIAYKVDDFTARHYAFLITTSMFVVAMCSPSTSSYFGGQGVLAILFVVFAFGTGFLNEDEFNKLNWDVILVLCGGNVLAYVIKDSGLGHDIANAVLTSQDIVTNYIWLNTAKITAVLCTLSIFFGNATAGMIILPLMCPLAAMLYAPEMVMVLAVMAVTMGMALPFSTADNYIISQTARDDFRRHYVTSRDVVIIGLPVTIIGWLLIITLGYTIGVAHWGSPPMHIMNANPVALAPGFEPYTSQGSLRAKLTDLEGRFRRLPGVSGPSHGGSWLHAASNVTQVIPPQPGMPPFAKFVGRAVLLPGVAQRKRKPQQHQRRMLNAEPAMLNVAPPDGAGEDETPFREASSR